MLKLVGKCTLAIMWGIPFAIVGILCTLTVIGAVIGMPLIAIGAFPLYWVQKKRSEQIKAWEFRARVMDNDEEKPWVM